LKDEERKELFDMLEERKVSIEFDKESKLYQASGEINSGF
jgi:hypothetical protein